MGYGFDTYGRQAGYTQKQWDALTQRKRDEIKQFIDGLGGAPTIGSALGRVANAGNTGYGGAAGAVNNYVGNTPAAPAPGPTDSYDGQTDYGSDGSDGSGSAYQAPRPLASSPEWLAYLNALGLDDQMFRSDIDRQRAFAKSAAEQQLQGIGPQYDQQRRGIAGNAEARGMHDSGQKLRDLSLSRANEGRDVSGVQFGLGQTLAGLESQLAGHMINQSQRKADQELNLRMNGYV